MLADRIERASRLRQAIKGRGLTFKEAAVRHHYVESTLTHHANGTRPFDLETGYAYAKAFKVDPIWLLGLKNEADEPIAVPAPVIRDMLEKTMRELPVGATVEDYLRVVPEGLRERLETYLADGGSQGSSGEGSAPGTAVPPPAATTKGAEE